MLRWCFPSMYEEAEMSAAAARTLLHRYVREVWDEGQPEAAERFLAPNFLRHTSPNSEPLDRDHQLARLKGFREAFPDITIDVEDVIVENDKVAFRSTMRGTHRGEFLGISPTGRQVTVGLVDIIRIEDGRFAEQWGGPDLLDLARQLGADI